MKNLNEMSKAEMEQEISFAKEFVNTEGCVYGSLELLGVEKEG